MALGLHLSGKDRIKIGVILIGAALFMWVFMIRPYSHEWVVSGETQGTVKTLMSNSNVIGSPVINAVITLDSGAQTIVPVPMRSNIRAGDNIVLIVQSDANKDTRKRYTFKAVKS